MSSTNNATGRVNRRQVLAGGAAGVAVFAGYAGLPAAAVTAGGSGFLSPAELETLRAVVDVFVPADADAGAVVAGCAEAIDGLLGAFTTDPPRIFAGGPFSDRGGASANDFATFLRLDPYEERGWRLRIHGSGGDPAAEFNGPVPGFQQVYTDGLAACEAQSQGAGFATLPLPARELILRSGDAAISAMVDIASPHTMEFMYGPPEYGGNVDLVGWGFTRWDGDVQPRGYTDEEVTTPDDPGPALPLPEDFPPTITALGTAEQALAIAASGTSRLSASVHNAEQARAAAAAFAARVDTGANPIVGGHDA